MTNATTDVVTREARKPTRCHWCWESIAKGESHQTYTQFSDGRASTTRMHPECYEAMQDYAREVEYYAREVEWAPGMERPARTEEEQKP